MRRYIYNVAELNFAVVVPSTVDIDKILPSMSGFRVESADDVEPIFEARCVERLTIEDDVPSQMLEQNVNDMGQVSIERKGEGYMVSLSNVGSEYKHRLYSTAEFRDIELQICWDDRWAGHSLNSLLRIAFAQAVAHHAGVSIHGSVVMKDDAAYLFLGKSGTGKSTHSKMWQTLFEDCELLNDDNPTIRIVDGKVNIYGTPWSGKTPCYKNAKCRLQGIVRLKQAPVNEFYGQSGLDAFVALLPGCAVLRFDTIIYNKVCDTLFQIIGAVNVGQLACLPDVAAAKLCYERLKENRINN